MFRWSKRKEGGDEREEEREGNGIGESKGMGEMGKENLRDEGKEERRIWDSSREGRKEGGGERGLGRRKRLI